MTWQPGHDKIAELLQARELERVTADRAVAQLLLDDAGRHLDTAETARCARALPASSPTRGSEPRAEAAMSPCRMPLSPSSVRPCAPSGPSAAFAEPATHSSIRARAHPAPQPRTLATRSPQPARPATPPSRSCIRTCSAPGRSDGRDCRHQAGAAPAAPRQASTNCATAGLRSPRRHAIASRAGSSPSTGIQTIPSRE